MQIFLLPTWLRKEILNYVMAYQVVKKGSKEKLAPKKKTNEELLLLQIRLSLGLICGGTRAMRLSLDSYGLG
jgi:hypothetical protein